MSKRIVGSIEIPRSYAGVKAWIEDKKYDGVLPPNSGYRICMGDSRGDYLEMNVGELEQIYKFVKDTLDEIELLQAIRESQGKLISKFAKDNRLLMQENRDLRAKVDYWKNAYTRAIDGDSDY